MVSVNYEKKGNGKCSFNFAKPKTFEQLFKRACQTLFSSLNPPNIQRNTLNLYSQFLLSNSVLFGISFLPYSRLVNKF